MRAHDIPQPECTQLELFDVSPYETQPPSIPLLRALAKVVDGCRDVVDALLRAA